MSYPPDDPSAIAAAAATLSRMASPLEQSFALKTTHSHERVPKRRKSVVQEMEGWIKLFQRYNIPVHFNFLETDNTNIQIKLNYFNMYVYRMKQSKYRCWCITNGYTPRHFVNSIITVSVFLLHSPEEVVIAFENL